MEAPRQGEATKAPDITVATIKEVDSEEDVVVDSEEDPLGEGSVDFVVDSFRYRNRFNKLCGCFASWCRINFTVRASY